MIVGVVREGLLRALGSPKIILWIWLANTLFALPATWAITSSIQRSAGDTLAADRLITGFDMTWHQEFQQGAGGLDSTFGPQVTGVAPFLDNLEGWLTGALFEQPALLLGLGVLWLLTWQLLQGGILDGIVRRGRRLTLGRFLGAGGRYFFRFVRLGLLSGAAYFLVYRIGRWAYSKVGELTRDVTSEREIILYGMTTLLLGALLLVIVHLVFAYAKIATVVEDRRSMFLAMLRGAGFVLSHPLAVLGVYGSLALISGVLLVLYYLIAPDSGQSTAAGVALAFLLGQLFLASKLVLRVALLGGQTALYRKLNVGGA